MTLAGYRHELLDDDPRHGHLVGYAHYGCRCRPCTEANRLHHKRMRAMRAMRERMGTPVRKRRARTRSVFPYPISLKTPGTRVQHKFTGRLATVVAEVGDELIVDADPTVAPKRPGMSRPAERKTWKRKNASTVIR